MLSETPPERRRVSGPRVVLVSLVLMVLITAFVITRMIQVSGPGPDPDTIPPRPSSTTTP